MMRWGPVPYFAKPAAEFKAFRPSTHGLREARRSGEVHSVGGARQGTHPEDKAALCLPDEGWPAVRVCGALERLEDPANGEWLRRSTIACR